MTCIIIEDQPPAQRILKKYIEDIGHLQLKATFSSAIDAISFLAKEKIDLIFLDIHLPKLSGMDFLKSATTNSQVILTTAFSDYALESYEYNVVDYLLKPFSFQRFVKAVSKLSKPQESVNKIADLPSANTIFIKSGYEYLKVTISDILYIKSDADYTEIYTTAKKYLTSNSLRYWLEKLKNSTFCQIHKSYIVNINHVVKIASNTTTLSNDAQLPIGRSYKSVFDKQFLN